MATYIAFLDSNNVVTQVVQKPDDGQDWASIWTERHGCTALSPQKMILFGTNMRRLVTLNYQDVDAFIGPSPYPSWSLNKTAKTWEAPVAKPDDELIYEWDEDAGNWTIVYDPAWGPPAGFE